MSKRAIRVNNQRILSKKDKIIEQFTKLNLKSSNNYRSPSVD